MYPYNDDSMVVRPVSEIMSHGQNNKQPSKEKVKREARVRSEHV